MQYVNGYPFESLKTRMYSPLMTIGDRLDKAMREAKIESQSELARKSGVPQATISRILKGPGTKGPETGTISKLAAACGVSFEYLNEGNDDSAPQRAADQNSIIDEIIELITIYRGLSNRSRELVMKSARAAQRQDVGSAPAAKNKS